ncbi:CD3324 family protein [Clostridium sp. AWRP]|uniref:CD3324 family protein n=1 Tax=Clostridium sp. AWRP TaxID=2212991 RepID=UPI001FAAF10D
MGYKKAADVLPSELVSQIQDYIDGEYIYIPRKQCNRKTWGEKSGSRNMLFYRNLEIYSKYRKGASIDYLSEMYYLSPKTIQKILSKMK